MRGSEGSRPPGLPHSEIPGSRPVCGSPGLIAAYHVLHRLLVPRHPPCAFSRLISIPRVSSRCDSSTPRHRSSIVKERAGRTWRPAYRLDQIGECGGSRAGDTRGLSARRLALAAYSTLQKGGDPAAGSPTATLLRLRPSHWFDLRRLRPCGSPTGFGSPQLPWRDGRCVQGPGTYSPWCG